MKSIVMFLAGLALFGAAAFWAWPGRDEPMPPARPQAAARDASDAPNTPGRVSPFSATSVASTAAPAPPATPGGADATEVPGKLQALAATHDEGALPALAVYLEHEDAGVREAAREAVVQLGASAGAVRLRAAADAAKDPREALELLDAADFLDLPPVDRLTPELVARRAADAARANETPPPRE